VNFVSITAEVAKFYKLPVKSGAYVHSDQGTPIMPGSPAEKAGLKNGDIITKVGGVNVGASGGVSSLVAEYAPGEKIEITVLRDGKSIMLQITLGVYKV
jgi:S1-C subfamily serine protease